MRHVSLDIDIEKREYMKKRIGYKGLLIAFLVLFVLTLIPLLVITKYNVPSADDFAFGAASHLRYEETGSFIQAALAAVQEVKENYFGWQGTFSAIFLMALQPAVFGEQFYFLGTIIVLSSLIAGIFYFCLRLFNGVFGMEKSAAGIVAVVIAAVCIQLVPSPVQGYFWYNGSVYYGFFYGLSLLIFGLAIQAVQKQGLWRWILLCVLAVIVGGGNYVTALTCAIVGVCAVLLLALLKNKNWKKLLVPLVFFLLAFCVNIIAPGNAVRQVAVQHEPNALSAIISSFSRGAWYSLHWLSLPMLGVMVLLLPLLWDCALKSRFKFGYPLLISVFSYCLLSAMFCPSMYAMGNDGDNRLINIIYYAYVFLIIANEFYWLGWLSERLAGKLPGGEGVSLPVFAAVSGVCLVCCGLFILNNGYSSIMALGELTSGEAQEYYTCAQERLEILKDEQIKDAQLESYPQQPYLLFFDDITTDPTDWRNTAVSYYYGKDSVVLKDP